MSMLNRFYNQQITYWGVAGRDEFGKTTFTAPIVFLGRWEDKITEVLGPKGESLNVRSIIHYPEAVPVDVDGFLFEGVSSETDPLVVRDAAKVQTLSSMPDIRNLEQVKVAMV